MYATMHVAYVANFSQTYSTLYVLKMVKMVLGKAFNQIDFLPQTKILKKKFVHAVFIFSRCKKSNEKLKSMIVMMMIVFAFQTPFFQRIPNTHLAKHT